jgi:hypothetical protein
MRPLWKALSLVLCSIGWPLLFTGSWIVEGADFCHERAQGSRS